MQPSERFIHDRKNAWQRLEELLGRLNTSSLRRLHREEVRELGRIYRRTASDLAIARAESRDPRLVNYLNSLVIRAHGRIYRANAHGAQRIREFFTKTFPQTFRRTWRYTALVFAFFLAFGVIGFIGTWRDPDFSEFAYVSPGMRFIINAHVRWWEVSLNGANQVGSSLIMANNIWVMVRDFAYGAFFGIGTLYGVSLFGINTGSVLALVYRAGYGNELVTFMSGHGVIELSCAFITGGAGLLMGSALLMPGELSRADALKVRGMDAIRLVVGCIPLLIIAAIIEGFISPAPISPLIKYSIAIVTGIALYSYLFFAGREKEETEATAAT
jgi:uncharacterized membrane protein SpoIIM required for sporulation